MTKEENKLLLADLFMESKAQKIRITIEDGIDPTTALERVKEVIHGGRVSKNETLYCYVTVFNDGIVVSVSDYRKSDCFRIYKTKKNEQF